ncbi:hypothetical protein [Candidatus Poriferisocius sp.]|uniref:hypothetical protein n=1 Tax=Candidatus Poriferisocius sp. TaxID=3101276 RepID=UPI003B022847
MPVMTATVVKELEAAKRVYFTLPDGFTFKVVRDSLLDDLREHDSIGDTESPFGIAETIEELPGETSLILCEA